MKLVTMIAIASAFMIGGGAAIITTPKAPQLRPVIISGQSGHDLPQDNTLHIQRPELQKNSRADKAATNLTEIEQPCLGPCLNTVAILTNNDKIDDESYEKLSRLLADFAAHLKTNPNARLDMIELAKTTKDGNKRALIIDAFASLPSDQRIALGHALTTSDDWQVRANGISVLSSSDIMTPDGAKALIKIYAGEPNNHVKTSVLKSLKNVDSLRGDQATLDYLSGLMTYETDSSVKSEAMLTKLALQEDPLDSMPDVFMALSSGEAQFQSSALLALERIYEANELVDGGLDRIDHYSVELAIEAFMNAEVTPENASEMNHLFKLADMFYMRHFSGN